VTDTIALRSIRVFARHGANPGERDAPQAFDIDVALDIDLRAARKTDALADTVDYAALHAGIMRAVSTTSYFLLERLGQDVLDVIFADSRVVSAEVCIAKPGLLGGATPSVTVRQER